MQITISANSADVDRVQDLKCRDQGLINEIS